MKSAVIKAFVKDGIQSKELKYFEEELRRVKYKTRFKKMLRSTIYTLIVVAAIAVLISSLFIPVLQISGDSMEPTLSNKEIIALFKREKFKRGEFCAFSWNNKTLIKRVIGCPGEWINIDSDGTVYINNKKLNEPYIQNKALGETDLTYPYQVPDGCYFVMGDKRLSSVDSRSSVIGCVSAEQVIGKVWFRVYPLRKVGIIN